MDISQNKVPKKRGRKPKNAIPVNEEVQEKPPPKKRGRKPKGGKIIVTNTLKPTNEVTISNIILHLKCSLSDLNEQKNNIISDTQYIPSVLPVASYTEENHFANVYEYTKDNAEQEKLSNSNCNDITNPNVNLTTDNINISSCCSEINVPDKTPETSTMFRLRISEKINKLQHDLIINDGNINTFHNSCCFHCTEPFDTDVIYIPKNFSANDNKYSVYGCFCSPECAAAHLMNENINDSEKFERYHLLNFIYGKIYDYKKPIRPAPNPYYTLNKFMGNISIEDYRNLFEYEKMLLVIEKPLTRNLPQLVEDNDNFQITQKNSKINTYSNLRKKNSVSKNDILTNNFGV